MAERNDMSVKKSSTARQRFAAAVAQSNEPIDLAEVALLIAQEEYPDIEVSRYLRCLDELAAAARALVCAGAPAAEQVAQLNQFLFLEQGFAGNSENYYDPRNTYLNEVLDRRTGIPISLGVVYSEVAQRLDLPVYGVSFPGHFLVKCVGDPDIIIDPYFGTVISEEECWQRLRGIYGSKTRFDRRLLCPASAREILVRMLSNLKQMYVDSADFTRALTCVDRILLLVPDLPRELRDRGILYQRLECYAAALRDFERYLKLAPDDEAAPLIRETLPDLQRQAASLQ
jgi:regulator of sirC expression with transglutaminase-like and TPR domain